MPADLTAEVGYHHAVVRRFGQVGKETISITGLQVTHGLQVTYGRGVVLRLARREAEALYAELGRVLGR